MPFEWVQYDDEDGQDKAYWKSRNMLGMTAESISRDVTELKRWLSTHNYLPPTLISDNEDLWLENYLLLNKNNVERTKSNLDTYFKIRTLVPEAFESRHPLAEDMDQSFRATCVALMPKLTAEGHMVVVYHHLSTSPIDFEAIPLGKRFIAMIDVQLQHTKISRTGTVIVCDLINSRLGHLTRYKPIRLVRAFFNLIWKAYPERIAQVHIINPPIGMQAALAFFRPFLKQKIRNRIKIHSNLNSLYEYVPRSHLPIEYGGQCDSVEDLNRMWQDILLQHFDWLEICGKKHKIQNSKWPSNDDDSGEASGSESPKSFSNFFHTFG